MSRFSRLLSASLFVLVLPSQALAQAGGLDPGFSTDGKVRTDFDAGLDSAVGLAVQPVDGKVVAAGFTVRRSQGRFALARYNEDGTLDTSFSGNGKAVTNFTRRFDGALDVVIQPGDGKIVAVGLAGGRGGRFAIARYNSNGSLDSTFGGDGRVMTNFSAREDIAFGVALQTDGKIVAAGRAGGRGGVVALVRYNADGTLDQSFGGDGKVTTNFTRGDDRADHLAVQTDGKIVAAGTAGSFGADPRFALARYEADGILDPTFGGDGKITTNFTRSFDGAFAVAVQADEKIVAAGEAGRRLGLARYNTDGRRDTSFGGDGRVRTNFTRGVDYADDLELQSDGKIVAGGSANFFGPDSAFALARYETTGALDVTFSGDGKVTTNFTPGLDRAFNIAIQPADGKIVAAGRSRGTFALARYLGS